MCIMKNIFVINSNYGSNSKLFKFGKKEFWCISVIKWWGMLGNLRREGIVML